MSTAQRLGIPLVVSLMFNLGGCSGATTPSPGITAGPIRAFSSSAGTSYARPLCTSGEYRCRALIETDAAGNTLRAPGGSILGLTPADLAKAYHIDPNLGEGMTVGIVDSGGYKDAEADLAVYRKQFGLPECTQANGCLTIVNDAGEKSPLPAEQSGWPGEMALDLDMVSAVCPKCKIILVEASGQGGGMFAGQKAAYQLGANVISNSWGGGRSNPSAEKYFQAVNGIGVFVASGDEGNVSDDYPSTSLFAIAVGGTSLGKSGESAWSGAGSTCSSAFDKPTYQPANTGCAKRATADIAAVADPKTGVALYHGSEGGWVAAGGTSAAAPIVAAIFAMTGNSKVKADFVYAHKEAFTDITSGSNGRCGSPLCDAGPDWDGPTGLGSPKADVLAKIGGMSSPPDMSPPADMTSDDMAPADQGTDDGGISDGGGGGDGGNNGGGNGGGSGNGGGGGSGGGGGNGGGGNGGGGGSGGNGSGGMGPGQGGCSYGPAGSHPTPSVLFTLLVIGGLTWRRYRA